MAGATHLHNTSLVFATALPRRLRIGSPSRQHAYSPLHGHCLLVALCGRQRTPDYQAAAAATALVSVYVCREAAWWPQQQPGSRYTEFMEWALAGAYSAPATSCPCRRCGGGMIHSSESLVGMHIGKQCGRHGGRYRQLDASWLVTRAREHVSTYHSWIHRRPHNLPLTNVGTIAGLIVRHGPWNSSLSWLPEDTPVGIGSTMPILPPPGGGTRVRHSAQPVGSRKLPSASETQPKSRIGVRRGPSQA